MKFNCFALLFLPFIGWVLMGSLNQNWNLKDQLPMDARTAVESSATPPVIPTTTPVIIDESPTPAERVLPRVGGNAGLVLGASVLVLIIIGGVVLTSRKKAKH